MVIIRHPSSKHATTQRAITIGNFDGVHRGHAAILDHLVTYAQLHDLTPTVITFSPNPKSFFAQQRGLAPLKQVLPLRDKMELFQSHGIQDIVVLPFNQTLANLTAEAFVSEVLCQDLNMKYLLVGDDFRFGAKRMGDLALLNKMSATHGYIVDDHHTVIHGNHHERISSSLIRDSIVQGNTSYATELLGHPYTLSGHIIYGQQLGRTIGIPTINIKMPQTLAAQGIYAVSVLIDGETYQGVASIGTRPSVKTNNECWLEVYVFDFNQTVYGKIATVTLHHKIRDEQKFDGMDKLMKAIEQDIFLAKRYFSLKK